MIRLWLLLSLFSTALAADPLTIRASWDYPDAPDVQFDLYVWPADEALPAAHPVYSGPGLLSPPVAVQDGQEYLARVYAVRDDRRSAPSSTLLFTATRARVIRVPAPPSGFTVIFE